jgi:hypothetical protein
VNEPMNPARCGTAELIRGFVRQTYSGAEEAAVWLLSAADTIERLTRESQVTAGEVYCLREIIERLLEKSKPQAVPCVDHPVLDVIARAITPAFRHLGPDCVGPAEDVTRESECVEFRDPATGQRFEIIVRPIPDEEDRP